MQGQCLKNSWKCVCSVREIEKKIISMNWVILLSRRSRKLWRQCQAGLHGKQCWKGHLLSKEGRKEGPTEKGVMHPQAVPPSQPVAFKCLGFPASLVAGPCWAHRRALKEFHPEEWEGNTTGGWRRVSLTAEMKRQLSDPCISDWAIWARQAG